MLLCVLNVRIIAEQHWNKEFHLPHTTKIGGDQSKLTLREIIDRLDEAYCGSIGVEYMHIHDPEKRNWVR